MKLTPQDVSDLRDVFTAAADMEITLIEETRRPTGDLPDSALEAVERRRTRMKRWNKLARRLGVA